MKKTPYSKMIFEILVDFFRWRKIKKSIKIEQNDIGLIFPYGIGDLYNTLGLLSHCLLKNNINSVIIVVKPSQRDILILFPEIKYELIVTEMPRNAFLCIIKFFSRKYSCLSRGNLVVAHPSFINMNDFKKMGENSVTIFDIYKRMLDLPELAIADMPIFPEKYTKAANIIFDANRFKKGRTVFIAPEANSAGCLPIKLWELIIDELTSCGFDVVINGNGIIYKNSINLKLSLLEVVPFINLCGYFISLRSGICELTSTAKCTKVIIYPDEISMSGSMFSCYSMKKNTYEGRLIEVIYKNDIDLQLFAKNAIKKMFNDA